MAFLGLGEGLLAKDKIVGVKAAGYDPALPSSGPANVWGVENILVRVTIAAVNTITKSNLGKRGFVLAYNS